MKARFRLRRLDALPFSLAVGMGASAGAVAGVALLLGASAWGLGGFVVVAGMAVPLALSSKPFAVPEGAAGRIGGLIAAGAVMVLGALAAGGLVYRSERAPVSQGPAAPAAAIVAQQGIARTAGSAMRSALPPPAMPSGAIPLQGTPWQ